MSRELQILGARDRFAGGGGMQLKQFASWRFSLIFFHRWLGILIGLMFVIWCISGIVLLYAGIPHITAGERLYRLPVLDASTINVSPQQALEATGLEARPFRLRVSMHNGRPVYRINTGNVFGNWTLVYADTGEVMADLDQEQAVAWLAGTMPEYQGSFTVETTLTGPDFWTHSPILQNHMPMHRIALDDAAGTRYYVSAGSGEAVMKTDASSRLLGLLGYNIHTLFFWRQKSWHGDILNWLSWTGLLMAVLGLALGIWRYSLKPAYINRGVKYRTPYAGWYKWHHYAGVIFGLFIITWVLSGLVSMGQIPGITETLYSPVQLEAGARTVQGQNAHVDFAPMSAASVRNAASRIGAEFELAELELVPFNGGLYFIGYRKPTRAEMESWRARSAYDFITPTLEWDYQLVSAIDPYATPFTRFDETALVTIARQAMPGANIVASEWLQEFDNYYYPTLDTFDLGLPRSVRKLPVLRLQFDDPESTWLYLEPTMGQMTKAEIADRRNRWGYYGLHGFDLPGLFTSRPLWDVMALVLLVGAGVLSCTTLVPMVRRLKRHFLRKTGLGKA